MIGYIYKTTHLTNNKIYVGKHEASVFEPTKYIGSGKILKLAIKKQRAECQARGEDWRSYFKCELVESCDNIEVLYEREAFWIDALDARNPEIGYNLSKGGRVPTFKGYKHTEKAKQKISEASLGRKHVPAVRAKIKKTKAENPYRYTPEVRARMSQARRGKGVGHAVSQETREKISNANKGKGIGRVPSNKGKKSSPETCVKIKEALKTAPLKRRKVICIEENLIFNSITEAAQWCNSSAATIYNSCIGKTKNPKGYHWQYSD